MGNDSPAHLYNMRLLARKAAEERMKMPEDNLAIWNDIRTPPQGALKPIKGGRLKGMSDISPQWRYQAMTECFGPCGQGWHYEIEKLWLETGSADQIVAFAKVLLYVGDNKPIPGIGGSMLVANESGGPYTSDEAYKMAVTDALGTAMKMLGMAADVYLGNLDGSKYRDSAPNGNQGQARTNQHNSAGDKSGAAKLEEAAEVTTATAVANSISEADLNRYIAANSTSGAKSCADFKVAGHWWWVNSAIKSGEVKTWLGSN